jgi:hypothetical protein
MMGDGGGADLGAAAQVFAGEGVAGLADLAEKVVAAGISERTSDQVESVFGEARRSHDLC